MRYQPERALTLLNIVRKTSCIWVEMRYQPETHPVPVPGKKYEKLFEQQKAIEVVDNFLISSNIDSISLKIGLQFLYIAMGKDVYGDVLELMPYIQGDIATTIAVTHLIVEYLESSDDVILPFRVEAIILQNVLQWLHSGVRTLSWT